MLNNNMGHAAIKISEGFKFTWDVDHVLNSFVDIYKGDGDQILDDQGWTVDLEERLHWQMLDQSVFISRFFYKRFTDECNDIVKNLKEIQSSLTDTNPLIKKFLDHNIKPEGVHLLKLNPGQYVYPHRDERNFTVNIGLKNANTADTYISDSIETTEDEFWKQPRYKFTMELGDVYLLNVKNLHSVESMVAKDSGIYRYIISYSINDAPLR